MTGRTPPVVACPQCATDVVWDANLSPYRPFCSERCKLIDLGQWATESYRIPQSEHVADGFSDTNSIQ